MPESTTFNTTAGQTIARKLLMAFLNTGTSSAPVWSIVGKRVEQGNHAGHSRQHVYHHVRADHHADL